MSRIVSIMSGALIIVLFAFVVIVMIPTVDVASDPPPKGLKPYTEQEMRGRQIYQEQGCVYCHTQQVRDSIWSTDEARGWGRPSVSSDYYFDDPHFLGTMRTGPDLINVGARQPSDIWHLIHLYQPRAVVPSSIMPSYPYLFKRVDSIEKGQVPVPIPAEYKPEGFVVPTQEALDLVAYLKSLDRTFATNN